MNERFQFHSVRVEHMAMEGGREGGREGRKAG